MLNAFAARTHDHDVERTDVCDRLEPRVCRRHGVDGTVDLHQRTRRDFLRDGLRRREGRGRQWQEARLLLVKSLIVRLRIHASLELAAQCVERRSVRDWNEVLPSNAFAARLDAALVVASRRPREARLEQIMRREGDESFREIDPV